MRITIEDVAKRAGVSKTTVSRILNGHYEHATEETRKRIFEVVRELNYRPNALAKGLKQMKTNMIGIVLANLQNPFWPSMLQGVEDTCRANGYNLVICNSNENPGIEAENIMGLEMRQVDGIIVNPTLHNQELFDSLVEKQFPIIAVKRNLRSIDTVIIDNILGSKIAIEHLLKQGRRKIAILVFPPKGIRPREERLEGYKKTMREHEMEVHESLIHIVPEGKGEIKRAVRTLLSSEYKPDAIYSTNGVMTLDIIEETKAMGFRIPEDIAIVGYDENVWSKYMDPPLTTIFQPSYEMGVLTTKKIIEKVTTRTKPQGAQTFVLEPHIIVRRSCGSTPNENA